MPFDIRHISSLTPFCTDILQPLYLGQKFLRTTFTETFLSGLICLLD